MTKATLIPEQLRRTTDLAKQAQSSPEFMTKKQVAEFLQCSQRQIELLTKSGKIAKPIYLSERSPRWCRTDLLASLGGGQ